MQLGFYFNQSRCTGCYTCLIACKDWHDSVDAEPQDWIRITAIEKGKFPEPSLAYLFLTCLHCADPACMEVCPAGAISKRETDGVVIVDRDICPGYSACGGACRIACPYDIPRFGAGQDDRMEKCDLCIERLENGESPVCVEACPMRALDAGPLDELRAKYGDNVRAEGFAYSGEHMPSICFKCKPA
jgi:anaerobic dimethyl sulfoxide reductase subunit B (iron-sulfur subunit)